MIFQWGEDFREDVSVMCNLSQKIKESGIEIGKKEMIVKMYTRSTQPLRSLMWREWKKNGLKKLLKMRNCYQHNVA